MPTSFISDGGNACFLFLVYEIYSKYFFLQTFLRLSYELNLHRQSAVDRETMKALTARCDEQNEELRKLREELGELPGLKEKIARCEDLKSRLFQTEQWREKAKKQLEISIGNLDKLTGFSATLGHEVEGLDRCSS